MAERENLRDPAARTIEYLPLGFVAVGLLLRLRLASGAVTAAVPDDAFYDFSIARSIAAGLPPSIDGVHATNGYHPLWVALLVAVFRFLDHAAPETPVQIARALGAACDALFLLATTRLLKALDIGLVVRTAAIAWLALNPWAVEQGTNGLETSLAMLLLALASVYHVRALERGPAPRFPVWSGVLIGLTALGRTELALVPLAWMCAVVYRHLPEHRRPVIAARALGVATLVVAPWLAYSLETTGTIVQSSATAMMFIFWKTPLVGGLSKVTPAIALERALHSIRDGVDLVTEYLGTGLLLGSALIGTALTSWVSGAAETRTRLALRARALGPLWASLGVLFLLFTTVRLYFETWHTAPFVWCLIVSFAVVADAYRDSRHLHALAIAIVTGVLVLAYIDIPARFRWNLTEASADRAARTDCGEDAYVSPGKITNIDGVVNNEALEALRRGRLLDYVERLQPREIFLDSYYHSSVFLGPRYRERLVSPNEAAPELMRLATPAQKDDRIRVEAPQRLDSAHGREVLSDGWLWDMTARTPDVRSVGEWSELIVVTPSTAKGSALELELGAMVVAEGKETQPVHLTVDGGAARAFDVARSAKWYPVDVPFDDRRHRIRLSYDAPKLRVERDPGARWWWRGVSYQINAVLLSGLRLAPP